MLGGVKAVILLLALVLIAGGAASSSTTDKHPEHVPYQHRHDSHPSHHQAPPLLEMLPPIGPIGFVLMGVMGDYYLSRYDHNGHGDDHNGHGDDHNGHHYGGEGDGEDNGETEGWVSDPSNSNNVKIEVAIRQYINKPTGELTKADLEKVNKLDIRQRKLTDVTALEKLTQLTALVLDTNHLTDVKGLENLTQLKLLWLGRNQLTDVKGLEKLTQLTDLGIHSNQLTDVRGFEKLTQLKDLDLRNNFNLTFVEIAELKKALPNCRIKHNPTK